MWHYKPDFNLEVKLACPKCGSIDLYTCYADYTELRVRCNRCDHVFYGDHGVPDPQVKSIVDEIRKLVVEANLLSSGW